MHNHSIVYIKYIHTLWDVYIHISTYDTPLSIWLPRTYRITQLRTVLSGGQLEFRLQPPWLPLRLQCSHKKGIRCHQPPRVLFNPKNRTFLVLVLEIGYIVEWQAKPSRAGWPQFICESSHTHTKLPYPGCLRRHRRPLVALPSAQFKTSLTISVSHQLFPKFPSKNQLIPTSTMRRTGERQRGTPITTVYTNNEQCRQGDRLGK